MSAQATSYVIEHSQHKGAELLCLLMIANHAHADGTNAWPGVDTLAEECRMSTRQIRRILRVLEESGELLVEHRRGRGNTHRFTVVMVPGAPLRRAIGTGDLPGRRRAALLAELFERQGHVCTYCGGRGDDTNGPDGHVWHVDRIIPGSQGGEYVPENVALSCATCNKKKGAKMAGFGAENAAETVKMAGFTPEENRPNDAQKPAIFDTKPAISNTKPAIAMTGEPRNRRTVREPSAAAAASARERLSERSPVPPAAAAAAGESVSADSALPPDLDTAARRLGDAIRCAQGTAGVGFGEGLARPEEATPEALLRWFVAAFPEKRPDLGAKLAAARAPVPRPNQARYLRPYLLDILAAGGAGAAAEELPDLAAEAPVIAGLSGSAAAAPPPSPPGARSYGRESAESINARLVAAKAARKAAAAAAAGTGVRP